MRIQHGDQSFEVKGGKTLDASIRAIASSNGFDSAVKKLTDGVYYTEFWYDQGGISKEYAERVMKAFLENGTVEAVEDWIQDDSNSFGEQEVYRSQVKDTEEYEELRDGMVVALSRRHPDESAAGITRAVDELIREACIDVIQETDESTPLDAIPPYAEVEMCFIPDYGDGWAIDDMWIRHTGGCSSAVDVQPDEHFARFLRFVNVSSDAYIEHIKAATGQDLRANPKAEDFERGEDDYRYSDSLRTAEGWRSLAVEADPDRPALLTLDEIVTVLDNASYGGVPVFACRMPLLDFIRHDWSKPITVNGGGFVGVHDFVNGSGYIEVFSGEMKAPANPKHWVIPNDKGYGIDSVYGIVGSYLRVQVEREEPEDTPAVKI